MAKRSKKTTPAPKRSYRRIGAISLLAVITALPLLAAFELGRRGIPAARQEGCVTGTTRLFYNMSGGNDAPADKVTDFCAAVLSGN